jgi:hypothetical protein
MNTGPVSAIIFGSAQQYKRLHAYTKTERKTTHPHVACERLQKMKDIAEV